MIFRTYFAMTNNYADLIYNEEKYAELISICEKAINILNKYNSIYAMDFLLDMLLQANYMLRNYEKANYYYKKARAVCLINGDDEHLKRIEDRINKKYKKLKE